MIYCLMGPTASGKTRLSLELAEELGCELISVDSAMVYRGMDIGTAKPSAAERRQVPHHLIDIADPAQPYSAAMFVKDADSKIQDVEAKGKKVLLVGGTMLYFKALQEGLSVLPQSVPEVRAIIEQEAHRLGWPRLHAKLASIDPQSALRIDAQDQQRITRALEVFELTGTTMSQLWQSQAKLPMRRQFANLALVPEDRSGLHNMVMKRFDEMLELGFLDEVAMLMQRPDLNCDLPAIKSVGYRQAWEYLSGKSNQVEMRARVLAATRQLAKRQLTWIRNWRGIAAFNCQSNTLTRDVLNFITKG